MSLASRLAPLLGRNKPSLPRAEMLALKPMRNPSVTWEPAARPEKDADEKEPDEEKTDETEPLGEKYILRVARRDDLTGKVLAWLFKDIPTSKKIELDEACSELWLLCDGAHTVDQLVKYTCQKYKLNRRQSEVSVSAFMRMLMQRRLIGLLKPAEGKPEHGRRKPVARPKRPKRRH